MTARTPQTGDAPRPLDGVRVIELAHWMAGPAAGGLLQDWGAEVVKIEPAGGEAMRNVWGAMGAASDAPNAAFISANRGKKSIELDVSDESGSRRLHELLEGADVLLTNLRPGGLRRLGLSPEDVRAAHPRLVYASLTAYGWGGPDEGAAGYDVAAFFGRSGISHEITQRGTAPVALLQGLGDTFTAMTMAAGICAALVERASTGQGRFVEASLMRTGMWALAGELGVQAMGGSPKPPHPREKTRMPMYNSYRTKDDRWFFLVGVDAKRQLPKVLAAIGRADLLEDERFSSARAIGTHNQEVIPLLDAAFAERTLEEWRRAFSEHDVFWGPIQTPQDVVDDPQAHATGAWITIDDLDVPSVDNPVRFDLTGRSSAARPPHSGEHSQELLD